MAPTYRPPALGHGNAQKLDSVAQVDGYEGWSSHRVADYFEDNGLGDYRELFIHHKITGKIAPLLTDADLKDIGIEIVGDRCRFRHLIKTLGRKARHAQRTKIIWEGKERIYFSRFEACVGTCCFIFPEDPSTYKLTNNHLKIKTVEPARIGPLKLCCCNSYKVNNIDLSIVEDVDISGIPAPCLQQCFCCAPGKDMIEVDLAGDEPTVFLSLREGWGESVSGAIMNQVEESQMIERD